MERNVFASNNSLMRCFFLPTLPFSFPGFAIQQITAFETMLSITACAISPTGVSLSMAARHDYWYPISTFGKAPSGFVVCGWSMRMNRASGSRLATIIMETHGKKNATRATNLATW
jgi:hypothetical protein